MNRSASQASLPTRGRGRALGRGAVIIGLVLLVWPGSLAHADNPITASLVVGWQGHVRQGQWAPIDVMLSSAVNDAFVGYVELSHNQDTLHRAVIQRPVVVPPRSSVHVPFITKLGFETNSCRLTVRNQSGKAVFSYLQDMADFSRATGTVSLVPRAYALVGVSGRGGLRIDVPENVNELEERFHVAFQAASALPSAWTGYAALDALVLYDLDWSQLTLAQHEALARWVANGGRLMLIVSTRPVPASCPVGRLLNVEPAGPINTTVASDVLAEWGLETADAAGLTLWSLPTMSDLPAGWRIVATATDGRPMSIVGPAGFGTILMCGFDPGQLPLSAEGSPRRVFWKRHLEMLIDPAKLQPVPDDDEAGFGRWGGYEDWTLREVGLNNILSHLLGIAALEPISVWWIVLILGATAVLIGPIDFAVLNRMNRLPWTYVTFAAVLTVVTVFAFYGVQHLRGGSSQLRRLTVSDKIAGQDGCWMTGYTGVFASRSGDYSLDGLRPDSWCSAIAPAQANYYRQGGSAPRNTVVSVQAEGSVPARLGISIWSMRTLLDEGPVEDVGLSATVTVEDDYVEARVTNTAATAIEAGLVRVADSGIAFGAIGPGSTITVKGPCSYRATDDEPSWFAPQSDDTNVARYHYWDEDGLARWRIFGAAGSDSRAAGIERWVDAGAAVVYAAFEPANQSDLSVRGRSTSTTHRQYVRLVIPPGRGR